MAHSNEDLLRRGYEAFATGDIDTVLTAFADDIAWHVGGSNQTSGDYHGHQEVMGFFVKLMELSGGSFRLDVHDILANDTHGIVLATAHGQRDGSSLTAREVDIPAPGGRKSHGILGVRGRSGGHRPILQLTPQRRASHFPPHRRAGARPSAGSRHHPLTVDRRAGAVVPRANVSVWRRPSSSLMPQSNLLRHPRRGSPEVPTVRGPGRARR